MSTVVILPFFHIKINKSRQIFLAGKVIPYYKMYEYCQKTEKTYPLVPTKMCIYRLIHSMNNPFSLSFPLHVSILTLSLTLFIFLLYMISPSLQADNISHANPPNISFYLIIILISKYIIEKIKISFL